MDDFLAFNRQCQTRVETALATCFPEGDDPTQLIAAMRYGVLNGGKRIRPTLAYAAAYAVNSSLTLSDVDPVACALECLHSYSLVHDDLPAMDDDDLRRGKPTCHIAFNEASAILAGDALQTLAFELLATMQANADTKLQLIQQLATASGAQGMILGQAIDLAHVDKTMSIDALETMHRHKTGALIRASVAMGATVAGASVETLTALDRYAAAIGLAFQVQDDILDVIGDTHTLGKQQGSDIALSKPTYVSLLGLAQAQAKAEELHQEALTALAHFGAEADYLRQLATYIVKRSH